ncbi:MAG: hypothetical protein GX094_05000 [Clostridiales bacterium]|jgi:hypothetical protein|nr:hypothetical protein [Clostridiales bacterium]
MDITRVYEILRETYYRRYYDVYPKLVPADSESVVKIVPLYDHCKFDEDAEYEVKITSMDSCHSQKGEERGYTTVLKPSNGILEVRHCFEGEQEHVLLISVRSNGEEKEIGAFSIYSLKDDLYQRRPYKGELHIHSNLSDGKESPEYVAAACRRIGFDFMAVTDHKAYQPSIRAKETYKDVDIDLKIFPGEEIHLPGVEVHIVNFGANYSISQYVEENPDKYMAEVEAVANNIDDLPAGVDRYEYAACVWCFKKIREGGGLGIFCHPYWVYERRYNVSPVFTDYMLEKHPFDAYELLGIGGIQVDSNMLQVAHYNEQRAKGNQIAIVGCSDAHGCERDVSFGWVYTMVFSKGLEVEDIKEAIKNYYSVAVEKVPGCPVRVFGPWRLVKYALFLLREFFPKHDGLCYEEGNLMLKYIRGEDDAAQRLKMAKGQTARLMNHYWSK